MSCESDAKRAQRPRGAGDAASDGFPSWKQREGAVTRGDGASSSRGVCNPAAETEHLQTELCYDKSAASAKGRQRGKRFPGLEKERLLSEQRRRRCPRVRPRHRVGRLQRSSPQLRAPKSCLQGLWRGSESAGLGLWARTLQKARSRAEGRTRRKAGGDSRRVARCPRVSDEVGKQAGPARGGPGMPGRNLDLVDDGEARQA